MTSHLTPISTANAPKAVGPYSQGMAAGNLVFVSGQLGLNPATGAMADPYFAGQAKQALVNMAAVLQASGLTKKDIAAVDVFVVDLSEFKTFNALYAEFMDGHAPARAVVQVSALPLGGLIEIKCLAVRP